MAEIKLPKGWVETHLGNIVDYGKTAKVEIYDVEDNTWVLELEDLEKDSSRLIQRVFAKDRVFKSTKNTFKKGDVLYGKLRPYLNKVAIADMDGVCTTEIIPMNAEPYVNNSYLFHWLKSSRFLDYVNDVSYGVNMPRLGTTDGNLAPIIIAPLAEQKMIAEKLDSLLAQVATIQARLAAIPQLIKRFRQSVLSAAVSGKLTEEWRRESNVFATQDGILADFVSIDVGQAFKSKEFTENGIRLLRGQNISPGALKWEETKFFSEDKLESLSHLFINENDIVLAMDRPIISTGLKLVRVKKSDLPCVLVQRVARFRDFKCLSPDYLYLLLDDTSFTNYIQPNQTGSDIPHISVKQILGFSVTVPELAEQTEIVRRVEQLFAYADSVEKQVAEAQARVSKLTQAILARAFSGELTADWRAQHPELISGEHSAAALLARIRAERAAAPKPRRGRKARAS